MDKNEIHLIQRLKKGDDLAFQEVCVQYYSNMVHIAEKYTSSFLTPKDFVQEALLRLHKYRHTLNEEMPLSQQLLVICRSVIINQLKREEKFSRLEVVSKDTIENFLTSDSDTTVEELLMKEEKMTVLHQLIDDLPPQQKKILLLHKVQKYSYEEIEKETGLSQKTIANHLYRAKINLKKGYDEMGNSDKVIV